jgi:hypothetical protein
MSDAHGVARALATGEPQRVQDVAGWRQAHEVRSLLDTLSIYRQCVVDLAAENMMLREELTVLRAIVAPAPPDAVRHVRFGR